MKSKFFNVYSDKIKKLLKDFIRHLCEINYQVTYTRGNISDYSAIYKDIKDIVKPHLDYLDHIKDLPICDRHGFIVCYTHWADVGSFSKYIHFYPWLEISTSPNSTPRPPTYLEVLIRAQLLNSDDGLDSDISITHKGWSRGLPIFSISP